MEEQKFISHIQLYNEDCLHLLKKTENESVDLVMIDPPYQISRETNFSNGKKSEKNTDRFHISMNFGNWDSNFDCHSLEQVIKECYRVLKRNGTIVCFYDIWKITLLKKYFDDSKFKQLRFVEWLKTNPVPINSKLNYLTNAREIAVTGVKVGKPVFNSEYDNGIYRYPVCHTKWRFHPTQKPCDLIESLILKHSEKYDLVLDCFSGSGTTAVACFNTQRNFIGCEIDKDYYDKSIRRIEQECGIRVIIENSK